MKEYYYVGEDPKIFNKNQAGGTNGNYLDCDGNKITGIMYYIDNNYKIINHVKNGGLHNVNGPALIHDYGNKNKYYYYNSKFIGSNLTKKQFDNLLKKIVFA